ncbi:MAG: TerB family tellurite resistance protein [Cyclobacteriaceae bacterium]
MKSQLNILINLASSDTKVSEREAKVLKVIAKVNGVSEVEFEEMLKRPTVIEEMHNFSESQKFEILYLMIQLMKADGQVFKSEIEFCEKAAQKLGYKREVIRELSAGIFSDPSITSNRKALMEKAGKFLNH